MLFFPLRLVFTLKFWPNFPNPIFANEHSSLVQRWLTRLNETSSDNRPSRHFSLEAFKELIFCLLFWIWIVFFWGQRERAKSSEVSWKERRKIWISEIFEIPRLPGILLDCKAGRFLVQSPTAGRFSPPAVFVASDLRSSLVRRASMRRRDWWKIPSAVFVCISTSHRGSLDSSTVCCFLTLDGSVRCPCCVDPVSDASHPCVFKKKSVRKQRKNANEQKKTENTRKRTYSGGSSCCRSCRRKLTSARDTRPCSSGSLATKASARRSMMTTTMSTRCLCSRPSPTRRISSHPETVEALKGI